MLVQAAIAEALRAEGVTAARPVFGVMGDGNMGLWAELVARAGTPVVLRSAWHEAAAIGMAEGFARSAGGLGMATVTCGPGLTHVATALVAAVRGRVPLLVLAGEIEAGTRGTAQQIDQRRFVEACGAAYRTLAGVASLAEDLRDAVAAARHGSAPVVLGMPMELLEEAVPQGWSYSPAPPPPAPAPPSAATLADLLDRIAVAERPAIIAGRGALQAGARDALVALADRIGALLATTLPAKGLFDGAPLDAGIAGGFSTPLTAELLGEADLVLGVGAELGDFTTRNGTLFPRATLVRIGLEAPEAAPHLRGDARAVADALLQQAEPRQLRREGYRHVAARLRAPRAPIAAPTDGLEPRGVVRAISAALPANAQVTCGVGHFWGFVANELDVPRDGAVLFGYAFGAIGQGLPLAIGAGIARAARPQLLIEGDGSLMQQVQELQTAAEARLPLVVLVMNDGGYGAERHKLVAKSFPGTLADWWPLDFVTIARAFGGDGAQATRIEDVAPLLQHGFAAGGLFVIDARISPTTMTDGYRRTLGPLYG